MGNPGSICQRFLNKLEAVLFSVSTFSNFLVLPFRSRFELLIDSDGVTITLPHPMTRATTDNLNRVLSRILFGV
jgi:hypothetical protein